MVQHGDGFGGGGDQVEVVFDKHHRTRRWQPAQHLLQPLQVGIVEPGGWFVEQQQPRRTGQGDGDVEQAALPVRQGAGRLAGLVGQAQGVEVGQGAAGYRS